MKKRECSYTQRKLYWRDDYTGEEVIQAKIIPGEIQTARLAQIVKRDRNRERSFRLA